METAGAWARSLPSPSAVGRLIEDHYALRPVDVVLVRSFTNDVYRIDTDSGAYALKIYGVGRFTADEVRWEQQLARHLVSSRVPVAADVALHDGDSVGILRAPEGERPFALTEWVPGQKPRPPWTDDLYRSAGVALARFHRAADSFRSPYPRSAVRTGAEAAEVVELLSGAPERRDLVKDAAEAAAQELGRLAGQGLRWGIRHGDPSLDNLHVSDGQVHLYDLDLAGPGWQVEDLTGALSTDFADAFLDGYTASRPLPPVELEALPWLDILATIDNLRFHLVVKPATQGIASLAEGWVDGGFEALTTAAHKVGLDFR